MKRILFLLLLGGLMAAMQLPAQSVGINTTGNNPDASAMLDVQSTTQGMLVPRMTSPQRTGISSPATGLLVYDLDTQSFWFHAASGWTELVAGNLDRLADADGNTQIQVEEGPDDNTIRFDVDGREAMLLNPDGSLTIRGDNPDDGGFLSLYNGDSTYFFRMFGGRLNDTAPLLNWQDGTALRFASSNENYSGYAEHMRITGQGNLGLGTNSPQAKLHLEGGQMLIRGDFVSNYSGAIPDSGAGTRLMWVPEKAAFRVGRVNGTQWDPDSIGVYSSVVGGYNNKAKGSFSFVGGGSLNTASGLQSFVGGGDVNTALGDFSFVGGGGAIVNNDLSVSFGSNVAMGSASTVVGGLGNSAEGNLSFVGGGGKNTAESFGEVVLGLFDENYTPNSTTTFNAADRLFVVGNGTGNSNRSNAMTLYKGGQLVFKGEYVSNYSGAIPDSGAGTRLMWVPQKAAFRVGEVTGTQWDLDSIGNFSSVAGGFNNTASGDGSSVAGGWFNTASRRESFVGGGSNNAAVGHTSFVGGGRNNAAVGALSFVGGGEGNIAPSLGEAVLGLYAEQYNTPANDTAFDPTDRLFVVGNGTSTSARSNALTILKNGRTGLGTSSPQAKLHVQDGQVLMTGTWLQGYSGSLPATGAGTRLMWIPQKAAFRAGRAAGNEWDLANMGDYSAVVGGQGNQASGERSFVGGGRDNSAEGSSTFVGGSGNIAINPGEVKLGLFSENSTPNTLFSLGNGELYGRSNAFTILKNGNTVIGGSDPGNYRLKVIQTGAFGINLENTVGNGWELFVDNSTGELELWSNGQKGSFDDASGIYTALSDARLKTAVAAMPSVMDRVMQLRPSQYQYKQDERGRQYLGFIAQEVEPLFPELVRAPDPNSERESYYTLDYSGFGIVAIKAVQEQQQLIEAQQAEIEALKAEVEQLRSLEARLSQLEATLNH